MKLARHIFVLFGITVLSLMLLSGCRHFLSGQKVEETAVSPAPVATGPLPVYYDFKDILIPGELKLDAKRRNVYIDEQVVAGVLFFEGRLEAFSLAAFFEEKMPQDGWRLINTFRHRKNYQMSFQKERAFCQITIVDNPINTEVEIRRTPILPRSEPMVREPVSTQVSPTEPTKEDSLSKEQHPFQVQPIK